MKNLLHSLSIPAGRQSTLAWAVGVFWLGIVTAGTILLVAYANTSGKGGSSPVTWPNSSPVAHNLERPTLVMFIHPHCPCSRASIGELALLMAHCQGRVDVHVFFLQPAGMNAEWAQTDTWRDAARIPGVTVHRDDDGQVARLFGAETSGHTALYSGGGRLLFYGGITAARGHSGDNTGRDAVQALLFHQPAPQTNTPVFGCSLFSCEAETSLSNNTSHP